MISLRKRLAGRDSRRMLLPALLFFIGATASVVGAGAFAALCIVPAGLAIDASAREDEREPRGET